MSKYLDQTEIHGNQQMRYGKVFAFVYSFHLIPILPFLLGL